MDYYINWGLCNLSTFKLPGLRLLSVSSQYPIMHSSNILFFCVWNKKGGNEKPEDRSPLSNFTQNLLQNEKVGNGTTVIWGE